MQESLPDHNRWKENVSPSMAKAYNWLNYIVCLVIKRRLVGELGQVHDGGKKHRVHGHKKKIGW